MTLKHGINKEDKNRKILEIQILYKIVEKKN